MTIDKSKEKSWSKAAYTMCTEASLSYYACEQHASCGVICRSRSATPSNTCLAVDGFNLDKSSLPLHTLTTIIYTSLEVAGMTLSQYQYEELSCESSFRLFRFEKSQPCSAVRADEISIQLFEASFEHSPEFEAVSYAWGQDPPSSFITCNGKQLHVTPNVEAILRILCVQTISVGIFWIDSICINQTNISEKNVQVPRMRSIYSEATRVWIWLGEGTHETKTAFSFILQVAGSSNWDSEYTRDTVRLAELHECFKGERLQCP